MNDDLLERLDTDQRMLLLSSGRLAAERGERAFLVGGSVRDLILERDHDDLDIVVEGDGLAVAQALSRSVQGELTRHHAFQTATVTTPAGLRVDVATARREHYPRPGQLPQVVPGSLREDLERRDFTINTMAISLDDDDAGALVDILGGWNDIRAGLIKVMHSRSFADDPTRILRALRFALRLGYEIDEETHEWLRQAVEGGYLADVSGDRVRKEIRLSFEESPVRGPLRLHDEGVLREIHPHLVADVAGLQRLEEALARYRSSGDRTSDVPQGQDWVLRLAGCAGSLSPQARWELVRRLSLSREERAPLIDAGAPWRKAAMLLEASSGGRDSDIERALRPLSSGALLSVAAGAGDREAEVVWRYLEVLRAAGAELTGADLLNLGVAEGPDIGLLLERLQAARLDGDAQNVDDERRLVLDWLAQKPR